MSAAAVATPTDAWTTATAILDHTHPRVREVIGRLQEQVREPRAFLQAAHRHLTDVMRAVYSIDERLPASELLRINGGSCSQRMACLEALARGGGIPTRVRALWLERRFWFDRLPLLRRVLPRRTLMPWPQFRLDGAWVDFDEIYGSTAALVARARHPFTNRGESLFDAISHVPVDFLGKAVACGRPEYSLSGLVAEDAGFFDTRDELVDRLERTTWMGRLLFRVTYGGRPVRRLPD